MSTAPTAAQAKESRVVLRYQWHFWAFTVSAAPLWATAGFLNGRSTGESPDTQVVSFALIALSLSLHAILLLTHARPDQTWPTPTTPPESSHEWHAALDKTGAFGGLIVFVFTPLVAIPAILGDKVELDPGIAATFVGILTVLGAYSALSELRPALHTASAHEHRVPFIDGPWPTIARGLALLVFWLAMFAFGFYRGA